MPGSCQTSSELVATLIRTLVVLWAEHGIQSSANHNLPIRPSDSKSTNRSCYERTKGPKHPEVVRQSMVHFFIGQGQYVPYTVRAFGNSRSTVIKWPHQNAANGWRRRRDMRYTLWRGGRFTPGIEVSLSHAGAYRHQCWIASARLGGRCSAWQSSPSWCSAHDLAGYRTEGERR